MTKYPIEAYTTAFDYLKHISSLCTGSILLMVAFLEKLFQNPQWKTSIAISLVSFLICVTFCLSAQAGLIEMMDKDESVAKWARPLTFTSFFGSWICFLVGLASLVAFALKNLY